MLEYYPSFIEAAIEFKVESRKLLAKSRNEKYQFKKEHEVVSHSKLYRLMKDKHSGYVYCCR